MDQDNQIFTMFAPAERATPDEVARLSEHVGAQPLLLSLLDCVPNILMILNKQRQIVLANRALAKALNLSAIDSILGMRPGEALNCIHSAETTGGCGTTEFCQTCGAAKAILSSAAGLEDVQECRILQEKSGDALDFRVFATPVSIAGERLTVFTLFDISNENRRRALERVFFHDVLNTAGGVRAAAEIFSSVPNEERDMFVGMMHRLSNRLVDEIMAQRDLSTAESGELVPRFVDCNPESLLEKVAELYRTHTVGEGKTIVVRTPATIPSFRVDATLLGRVVGNMTKNALEAIEPGETVTLSCTSEGDNIIFAVHNPGCMPREIQLQVFQRSFSTKGVGRGLGTYSIKMLTERYLRGKVWFSTDEVDGTVFYASLPLVPAEE